MPFRLSLLLSLILLAASVAASASEPLPPPPPPPPPPKPAADAPAEKADAQEVWTVPDSTGWTVDDALRKIRSSDKNDRLGALRRIAKEPGETMWKWISESARFDPEPRIRYEAVRILGQRRESPSLPILMHLADDDKDERVRQAAFAIVGPMMEPKKKPKPAPAAPTPAPDATTTAATAAPAAGTATATAPDKPPAPAPGADAAPATPPPPAPTTTVAEDGRLYDPEGNELPPGWTEATWANRERDSAAGNDPWAAMDSENIAKKATAPTHSLLIPWSGIFGGPLGRPRDAFSRTGLEASVSYAYGSFETPFDGVANTDSTNRFVSHDLSLYAAGRWALADVFELSLEAELFTLEMLSHDQDFGARDDELHESETASNYISDASYTSPAVGMVAIGMKIPFYREDLLQVGFALRAGFAPPLSERYGKGIGAANLFRENAVPVSTRENETSGGMLIDIEPGVVFSVAPIEHLTISGDLAFAITVLPFTRTRELYNIDDQSSSPAEETSQTATALTVLPALAAQYRLLGDRLGLQLGLQPAIHINLPVPNNVSGETGLAGLAIVPGAAFSLSESSELGLTFLIDAAPDAPNPFLCTDLTTEITSSTTNDAAACGTDRRIALSLGFRQLF